MRTLIGIVLFGMGLLLDSLNLIWAFQSARGQVFKSGLVLVPWLLYVAGVLLLAYGKGVRFILALTAGMLIVHIACYQLIPWVFDKIFDRGNRKGETLP